MRSLVFLHGVLSLVEEYAPLLDALGSAASLRPFPAPGHGRPLGHPLRMREWVDAASAFADDVGPCVLVGHSGGGHVAMHVAAAMETKVQGVMCLETPMRVRRDVISTPEAVSHFRSLASDPQFADAAYYLAAQDFDAFFDGFDEDALAYDVDCPILIVGADPDKGSLLTAEGVERARARLPQAEIQRIAGTGHMLGISSGDLEPLTRLIERFLTQLPE